MAIDSVRLIANTIRTMREWREHLAEEGHRDDFRNRRSIGLLLRLEQTVAEIPPELLTEFEAVFRRWSLAEVVLLYTGAVRAVGFLSHPGSASEFVRSFIQSANAQRRQHERPRLQLVD